jgi:serine/threonine-protein kinase HipA
MLKVWTDGSEAGLLEHNGGRAGERGTTFAYLPEAAAGRAVSVTMPVRLASWDTRFGLAPIFEMNLPEGALRERLRLAFAKATGSFDELDLLAIVGRSQMGRVRVTGREERLDEDVPFQSVAEILSQRRDGTLFQYLIEKFATSSGISGVQPKFLLRDAEAFGGGDSVSREFAQSYRGATHIVKFWENLQFPQLAANEFFCLTVARRCGLEVPRFQLSEDGRALVVERFDLRADGAGYQSRYLGFEDFCVLNARRAADKYNGSYETAILKRLDQFAISPSMQEDRMRLFTLIALNCALRNGDAHLKNFGILYDDVEGEARLAPVYDVVTTTVYLPKDGMALTLNGSTRWASAKELKRLGETRAGATPAEVRGALDKIAEAMAGTLVELQDYMRGHAEFREVGERMIVEWEAGLAHSLQG